MRYQIRKFNSLNWQLCRWEEGGRKLTGKFEGMVSQPRWAPMESYHPTISLAAKALLDVALIDECEEGLEYAKDLLGAISRAQAATELAVEAITKED